MPEIHEVRAHYDASTITVYQAYSPLIARPALAAQRFVPPFSTERMTWIKPSFLWMMERSNWGQKSGQEMVLAVRIQRSGWDAALEQAELTSPSGSDSDWRSRFEASPVHVQWDPERSLRGEKLAWRSIQVGLSRRIIRQYVEDWTVEIVDLSPIVKKILGHCQAGRWDRAREALPRERVYPVVAATRKRLAMEG